MPENRVKFGLKKCYYAVITENDGAFSYGTPVAMPGAVSLAANKSGDSEAFEADDKDFWVVSSAQYDITLEVAKLPESFFTDVFMYTADAKGVLWESGAECKRIALLFEQNGDQKPTRYAFLACRMSRRKPVRRKHRSQPAFPWLQRKTRTGARLRSRNPIQMRPFITIGLLPCLPIRQLGANPWKKQSKLTGGT